MHPSDKAGSGSIPAEFAPGQEWPSAAPAGCSTGRMRWDFHHGLLAFPVCAVVLLQRFPLAHQIPYLPHQGLMTVDHRLGCFPVVVKP